MKRRGIVPAPRLRYSSPHRFFLVSLPSVFDSLNPPSASHVPRTEPAGRRNLFRSLMFVLGVLALPPLLSASTGEAVPRTFIVLALMFTVGKVMGEAAERIGQPAVLGELLAGVLLGRTVLGIVPTEGLGADYVYFLAQLGVVLLLFEIGLETNLKEMFRVGWASLSVATVGVLLPFLSGFLYWMYAPHLAVATRGTLASTSIFVGATLTATSVGITARVLSDLKVMNRKEARIIIGAAVADDIIGLVILSVVSGIAAGTALSVVGISRVTAIAVGFLVGGVMVGRFVAPKLFNLIDRMRVRHVLLAFAVAFLLTMAALATLAGSALIIGAFAAGLILSGVDQFDVIEREVKPIVGIFAPLFFVYVGASVDFGLLNPFRPGAGAVLGITLALTIIAFGGKIAAGWAAPWERIDRLAVGVGMIPRGEVGLIFADIGRRSGLLGEELFSAILLMVMVTTLVAPIGLKAVFRTKANAQ
jgi:Kef-type K+ transport system membrane component KefB